MSLLLARRRPLLFPTDAAAAGYADEVLADNPLAYWRFEETSGETVADEVGTNDGTVFGADLNVSGPAATGSAASFDGTDDYIDVGTLGTFGSSLFGGVTYEFLFRTSSTARQYMCGTLNGGARGAFAGVLVNDTDNTGRLLAIARSTDAMRRRYTSSSNLNDGEWRHFAATLSDGSSDWDLYIDGQLDNGTTRNDSLGAGGDFEHGFLWGGLNNQGTPGLFYGGYLDEPALYDKVLDPARILAHAQAAGVA